MQTLKIICPNGHLGFAPLRPESFRVGVATAPDYIAADSGSDDVGPVPLGTDTSTSPLAWQTQDLEHMLLASRRLGVPMIIGSSGDTGSNSRVDLYVQIIRDLATKHRLNPFRLGYFYSEVDKVDLLRRMRAGEIVHGLEGHVALTEAELDATERIVAMAGVHPFIDLLRQGADVIIGGRSSDSCVFAAPAIHHGYPEAQAYYLGKVLECASFCAEPYGGRTRDVRALESLLRARGGWNARHVGVPLRAAHRKIDAHHGREVPAGIGVLRQAGRCRKSRRTLRRPCRYPRPVHHCACRRGHRMGAATGARTLRRHR